MTRASPERRLSPDRERDEAMCLTLRHTSEGETKTPMRSDYLHGWPKASGPDRNVGGGARGLHKR
jgi:hypothetical protein